MRLKAANASPLRLIAFRYSTNLTWLENGEGEPPKPFSKKEDPLPHAPPQDPSSLRLRAIRGETNMSQREFADFLGVKLECIEKVEAGKACIESPIALALEKKLRLSFKWLMTGEGEPFLPESGQPGQPTIQALVRATFGDMPDLAFPQPVLSRDDIEYSMKRARRVLESKLHLYASALYVNIASFYRATLAEEEKLGAPSREPPEKAEGSRSPDPFMAGPPPAGVGKGIEGLLNGGLDSEAKKKIKKILSDDNHLVVGA